MSANSPGRHCPLAYRSQPRELAELAPHRAGCVYVIGGLYGNAAALDAIQDLATAEPEHPLLCFNGDFNWFDVDPDGFTDINRRVLAHLALRGNVETELGSADPGAGCGCAYPEWVEQDVVDRSNAIMRRLQQAAAAHPALRERLAALPAHTRLEVGKLRVGVVHGDAESLAGWGFAREQIDRPEHRTRLRDWFEQAEVDVFASSHTCAPVLREFAGERLVVNNGAAGMPNFRARICGLLTRIGTDPSPHASLYGRTVCGVHVDALAIAYDQDTWLRRFLANWPAGSPAHESYYARIARGPDYSVADALG